jgi:ABC transporter substrate binding protein (PQQ-dependent alcohol dehydrogenase system)
MRLTLRMYLPAGRADWLRRRRLASALALVVAGGVCATAQEESGGPLIIGAVLPAVDTAGGNDFAGAMARAAEQGIRMAEEEHAFNAELFGLEFEVVVGHATGASAVVEAAGALATEGGAIAIIGAFTEAEALALAAWAEEQSIPFLNVGSSSDVLRNEECRATMYHVEPSAAMYLDALAGWYVRSGFRNWYFIQGETGEAQAQYDRALWSLRERHFGGRPVGRTVLEPGEAVSDLADEIMRTNADLVVLLLDAEEQVRVLRELEDQGVETVIAAFPYPEAQTRTFYRASREAAPNLGTDHRAASWEPTLDAYGAREINARFLAMFDEPMEPTAWAAYQAVKVVFEAATLGGSMTPDGVMAYLDGPQGVFDIWKGIGVSFRSWDRQLRQSLYLVNISATAEQPFEMATLVGELPAIYMPGTDPIERLDQLGDLRETSRCPG